MYNDIVDVYDQIFPLNQAFLGFLRPYLPEHGGRVLDLGCGPGAYVGLLAEEGYEAVGIDNSEGMIAAAKAKHRGDFYPYGFNQIGQLPGRFDTIYCIGNSLSYLKNDGMEAFMIEVERLLRTNGYFLVQMVNWDRFIGQGRIEFEVKPVSEGRSFHRRYVPGEDGTVIFHTALRKGDQLLGEWADRLYPKTKEHFETALLKAGLTPTGCYGDFMKNPFDSNSSPALILAATA